MTPLAILLTVADSNNLTADAFARALNAPKVKNSKPNGKAVKLPAPTFVSATPECYYQHH